MKVSSFLLVSIIVSGITAQSQIEPKQDQNLYRNVEHKFRIVFPQGWTVKKGLGLNIPVKALDDEGRMIAIVIPSLPKPIKDSFYEDISDEQIAQEGREVEVGLKKAFQDVKLVESGKTKISGRPAIWFKMNATRETAAGNLRWVQLMFMVIKDGRMYQIGCGCLEEQFEESRPIFLKTASMFEFEDFSYPPSR